MKIKKKSRITIIMMIVIVMIAASISGCAKERTKKKDGEIYLYYADNDQTSLVTVIYKPKNDSGIEAVREVIDKMNETSTEPNTVTAKPDTVEINDMFLNEKILTIDFNMNYEDMGTVAELLCRSAIVLTVCQLEDVDCVNFTIEGEPLCDSQNQPIGHMAETDFVDHGKSDINSFTKADVTLYFADSTGRTLVPVNYEGICDQNTSVEKMIVESLMKGPKSGNYTKTLPSNIRLLSVITRDGICYVNFDTGFLSEIPEVSAELEIYSIVNSLSELSYINKVQISVNGSTNKKLRDEISLEFAFSRNLDVVTG